MVFIPFGRRGTGRRWPLVTRCQLWKKFLAESCPRRNTLAASTSRFRHPVRWGPCHGPGCSFQGPWFWTTRSRWFWCHRRFRRSTKCCLKTRSNCRSKSSDIINAAITPKFDRPVMARMFILKIEISVRDYLVLIQQRHSICSFIFGIKIAN